MATEQQLKQQQNEATLNNLSDNVIGQTSWGQFYGLIRNAAAIGEGSLPHKICISQDGREIKVYKSDTDKLVAAFLKPTHEYVTDYIAQEKYGEAVASLFGIYGQLKSVEAQQKAKCITVTPNDVLNMVKNSPNRDSNTGLKKSGTSKATQMKKGTSIFTPKNIAIGAGIWIGVIALIVVSVKLSK